MVGAEREQQAEREHAEAGSERPHVDERAARDHQAPERDERCRRDVCRRPDRASAAVLDPPADDAAFPPEPEERCEEDPCGREA